MDKEQDFLAQAVQLLSGKPGKRWWWRTTGLGELNIPRLLTLANEAGLTAELQGDLVYLAVR